MWSGSARRGVPTATSVGTLFRSCSHLLMFRPTGLLATPVAPTSRLSALGSRGFYIRAYQSSLPHPAADMLSVQNRAIDGRRTFTSQDWQPCRLLPIHRNLPGQTREPVHGGGISGQHTKESTIRCSRRIVRKGDACACRRTASSGAIAGRLNICIPDHSDDYSSKTGRCASTREPNLG